MHRHAAAAVIICSLNKSHGVYSREAFITMTAACVVDTNQGWILFMVWRLTKEILYLFIVYLYTSC